MVQLRHGIVHKTLLNYLIVSTGRSRSGVLAAHLSTLGCGEPNEFFEVARFDVLNENATIDSVKDALEARRSNGILGMRMVWSHVRAMHECLSIGIKEFTDTCLPDTRYIYVERDPWRQAIESSLQDAPDKVPVKKIKRRVAQIIIGYQAWDDYFTKHDIAPYRIRSEDFQTDPNAVCKGLYQWLGMEYPSEIKLDASIFDDALTTHEVVEKWYNRCLGNLSRLLREE